MDGQWFRNQMDRILNPISTRIRNMIARAVIKTITTNQKVMAAQISILKNELKIFIMVQI